MPLTYRVQWTRQDTGETGLLPDVYATEAEAREWAREWTQQMLNLDPGRKTEITFCALVRLRQEGR